MNQNSSRLSVNRSSTCQRVGSAPRPAEPLRFDGTEWQFCQAAMWPPAKYLTDNGDCHVKADGNQPPR